MPGGSWYLRNPRASPGGPDRSRQLSQPSPATHRAARAPAAGATFGHVRLPRAQVLLHGGVQGLQHLLLQLRQLLEAAHAEGHGAVGGDLPELHGVGIPKPTANTLTPFWVSAALASCASSTDLPPAITKATW